MKKVILYIIFFATIINLNSCTIFYSQDLYDGTLTSWSYGLDITREYSASRFSRTKHYWEGGFYRLLLTLQEFNQNPLVEFRIVNDFSSPKNNLLPSIETNSTSVEFEDNTRFLIEGYPFYSAFRIRGKNAIQLIELFKKHKEAKIKITINKNTVMVFCIDISEYNQNIPVELTSFLRPHKDTVKKNNREFSAIANRIPFTPVSFMDIFQNKNGSNIFNSDLEKICIKKGYEIIKTNFILQTNNTQQKDSFKIIYLGHNMLYNNAWIPIKENYSGVKLMYTNKQITEVTLCYDKTKLTNSFLEEAKHFGYQKNLNFIKNKKIALHVYNNLLKFKYEK